jgi:predicted nucleotide-binding protein
VLTPEETTVPNDARDAAESDTLHLRLSADAEFMLGLMTGALGVEHTFIVVPEDKEDQPVLTSLLAGITLATYEPGQVGKEGGNAMGMTCTKIAQTISNRERNA